jgi:hypothetical protein
MGLDIVELFIRFEDEFELKIPDEVAATLETPRMVIDYLMTTPEIRNKGWSREIVAEKIWFLIEDEQGINPAEYNEDSYFVMDMGMN